MIKYGLLTAEDTNASEFEVYDFLYGLVRLLKPKIILETGCYKGGATRVMEDATIDNQLGKIFTCDTDPAFPPLISSEVIAAYEMEGVKLCRITPWVDLAFIDSSGDRVAEVAALNLSPNAVVVLHDSNREQYKPIWTLKPWKAIWHIPTEQGITVFQL